METARPGQFLNRAPTTAKTKSAPHLDQPRLAWIWLAQPTHAPIRSDRFHPPSLFPKYDHVTSFSSSSFFKGRHKLITILYLKQINLTWSSSWNFMDPRRVFLLSLLENLQRSFEGYRFGQLDFLFWLIKDLRRSLIIFFNFILIGREGCSVSLE